jgi:hypothetical protein
MDLALALTALAALAAALWLLRGWLRNWPGGMGGP